ncbi:MAG TPA: class I SAM-dependent methyltransferase, partial [Acidimicrobiia bacterium]|nr:class I SAM-dependent methyltransferase [Acidimicrobiia bacterium]
LDIGCGNGITSRDAARAVGPSGEVVGVDLSGPMLARAEQLAADEGLGNIRFERADAQVHRFEPEAFDVVVSRFGTMFFEDPVAAFTNIASALRPTGRLVMLVWQSVAANEWIAAIAAAVAVGRDLPAPPPGSPSPFALADIDYTGRVLTEAGFIDVAFAASEQRWWVGSDADDAYGFITGLKVIAMLLDGLDDTDRAKALDNLRATLTAHETPGGVEFGSASWIITARKP